MKTKSPFLIFNEFISPLDCEDVIGRLNLTFPNTDVNGRPLKTVLANRLTEIRILPLIENIIPDLEEYYNFGIEGVTEFLFEHYPMNFKLEAPRCENSALIRGQWTKINGRDLCCIIFLNDYQDKMPYDPEFEVYGGKLEFINHDFAISPKRGTMVVFPGNEYFINHTSKIMAGELNQIRFFLSAKAESPLKYTPLDYQGDHTLWFPDK